MFVEKFTVSNNRNCMEGWPDLIRLTTGRLLLVYNECTSHINRDHTFIIARISDDNGETWSDRIQVGPETMHGNQYNSIRVNQLNDGRVVIAVDKIVDNELDPRCQIHLFFSNDDGLTWSEAHDTGIHGYCSDKIRELPNQKLMLLVSHYDDDIKKSAIYAHYSDDNGMTWSNPQLVAKDANLNLIEPAALVMKCGAIVVFIRENSYKDYDCMKVISFDNGVSWSKVGPHAINRCHRPFVGYLHDGRIMITYRRYDTDCRDLWAAIFDEACALESSQDKQMVSCVEIDSYNGNPPDGGYSAWVELSNTEIFAVNYVVDQHDEKAFIRGYRIFNI